MKKDEELISRMWQALRKVLKEDGLNQATIARAIGIDKGEMSRYWNGGRTMSLLMIMRITDAFQIEYEVVSKKEEVAYTFYGEKVSICESYCKIPEPLSAKSVNK